jgi:cell wall-associated NlpC family hydrolase
VAEISRAAWLAEVLSYLGTPYAHQGRVPGVGMDCVAPLIVAARKFAIVPEAFDVQGYARDPDGSLQPLLDAHLIRKPRAQLVPGDVVLNGFRLQPPQHVAIIVGERHGEWELLHAHGRVGKVQIERIQYGRYWRYVCGYAVPGVA